MKKKIVLLLGVAAAVWGVKKLVSGGDEIVEPYAPELPEERLAA